MTRRGPKGYGQHKIILKRYLVNLGKGVEYLIGSKLNNRSSWSIIGRDNPDSDKPNTVYESSYIRSRRVNFAKALYSTPWKQMKIAERSIHSILRHIGLIRSDKEGRDRYLETIRSQDKLAWKLRGYQSPPPTPAQALDIVMKLKTDPFEHWSEELKNSRMETHMMLKIRDLYKRNTATTFAPDEWFYMSYIFSGGDKGFDDWRDQAISEMKILIMGIAESVGGIEVFLNKAKCGTPFISDPDIAFAVKDRQGDEPKYYSWDDIEELKKGNRIKVKK